MAILVSWEDPGAAEHLPCYSCRGVEAALDRASAPSRFLGGGGVGSSSAV